MSARKGRVICLGCTPGCYKANCSPEYKETPTVNIGKRKAQVLSPSSESTLAAHASDKLSASPYYPLLRMFAQMLDQAVAGENVYAVIGTTKSRDAVTITVKQDGDGETLYDADLAGLADQCSGWLQTR